MISKTIGAIKEKAGFRMEDFEAFDIGIFKAYLGVFDEGNDGHGAFITSDWNEFVSKWEEWGKQNLRMNSFRNIQLLRIQNVCRNFS